jgi:hypothetical protein
MDGIVIFIKVLLSEIMAKYTMYKLLEFLKNQYSMCYWKKNTSKYLKLFIQIIQYLLFLSMFSYILKYH